MKRLEFLDGLRGLAALYVLVYHLAKMPPLATGLPAPADAFILFGNSGVILFFVISAFCLCLTMPERDVTGGTVANFYLKRFFRIAPLFYAVVAVTLLRNFLVRDIVPPAEDVLANLTFTFNLFPGKQDSLVFAGWTIGVEMLFYLVFPVLYVLLRGIAAKILAFGIAGLAFPALLVALGSTALPAALQDRYALLTLVHYLPVFLLGMIAFDLFNRLHARGASWRTGVACLAAGALLFAGHLGGILVDPDFAPAFWQGTSYTLLLLGLAFCPIRILVNPATRFLGLISYSVYLLHGPVILLINRPVYPRIYALDLPTGAKFGLCFAITLAVTLSVSWLSHRMIERPGITFGRRLIAARGQRSRLAAQAG
jgi:peptidoglycan/LPS O-acetylase OafA/YrhL